MDAPRARNGVERAIGRLEESIRANREMVDLLRSDISELALKVSSMERILLARVSDEPGQFLAGGGAKASAWDASAAWVTKFQARLGVYMGIAGVGLAIAQGVAGYLISQYLVHAYHLDMIRR